MAYSECTPSHCREEKIIMKLKEKRAALRQKVENLEKMLENLEAMNFKLQQETVELSKIVAMAQMMPVDPAYHQEDIPLMYTTGQDGEEDDTEKGGDKYDDVFI
ncbi:hypothetical protein scyTo_0003511 [Scyliorhinus torazame]|uniref:Uncharacterized protein n=1 Tax=Scyliorhinus torazame TaxID=75743 RepID=A0A401PMW4_SCYTO|nr:hypothetical protein [Scyliorhinus torazame]